MPKDHSKSGRRRRAGMNCSDTRQLGTRWQAFRLPAGAATVALVLFLGLTARSAYDIRPDEWSGRLAAPAADGKDDALASIARARDMIRILRTKGPLKEPVVVHIRGGTYTLKEPI